MKLSALDIIEIAKEYNVEILNKNQYLMILNRSRKLSNNIKRMIIKITEETIININKWNDGSTEIRNYGITEALREG